ncbi:hypothetical protein ACNARK_00750 [Proteus sp. DFP240708]|nr:MULTISPECIES: hypothetical protein [Proteus]MBI6215329.1 hypothetical protein [Proteus vulgaris]MBI6338638.1 hypothetical protein [Proteus sp. PR00224]
MSLNKILKTIDDLSAEEKTRLFLELNSKQKSNNYRYFNEICNPEKSLNLFALEEHEIKKIITLELKKQGITYEEMAMQIDINLKLAQNNYAIATKNKRHLRAVFILPNLRDDLLRKQIL